MSKLKRFHRSGVNTTTISGSFYTYIRKMWRVTVKTPAYFPKGFIENMFSSQPIPRVSFTSFDLNVANMDNFFAPVFTMGKYYTQGDKVLMPLAIQVHHAVCDGFHVGRMLNELQQYCDEWQGGA
ncbi:chloramphenicol acetyltransferase [Klebsiella pneumoniae]|uniref:Chloramphenicol acetyltransferase n=1 Tax=Klebsiella pneumoniae TaxID=573 RepID=A0A927DQ55_KLEPN|nr:chloramphenicol acetyltransferase [Klebsiella pneumoniae]